MPDNNLPPPPIPAQPLDYRTRGALPRPIFSVFAFIITCLLVAIPAAVLLFLVPKCEQIFKDFGTKLPAITQLLLSVSRWFNYSYGWLFIWPLPIIAGFVVPAISSNATPTTAEDATRRRWLFRFSAMMILIWIFLAMFVFVAIALVAPMISLMQAVSSPKH